MSYRLKFCSVYEERLTWKKESNKFFKIFNSIVRKGSRKNRTNYQSSESQREKGGWGKEMVCLMKLEEEIRFDCLTFLGHFSSILASISDVLAAVGTRKEEKKSWHQNFRRRGKAKRRESYNLAIAPTKLECAKLPMCTGKRGGYPTKYHPTNPNPTFFY